MVRLDALACGACLDELVDCRRQPQPPHAPAGDSAARARVLSLPKLPPRGVACSSVSIVLRSSPAAGMHKRSPLRLLRWRSQSLTTKQPGGCLAPAGWLRLRSSGNGSEHQICRKGDAHCLCKVSGEEPGPSGVSGR
jgi:hypothetical protein